MKYKNYAELKNAYISGELDRVKNPLYLDNDVCFVCIQNKENPEDEDITVFQGNGYQDLEELAILAGLPAEWV